MPMDPIDIIEIFSSREASPVSMDAAGLRAGGPSNTGLSTDDTVEKLTIDAKKQSQAFALPDSRRSPASAFGAHLLASVRLICL